LQPQIAQMGADILRTEECGVLELFIPLLNPWVRSLSENSRSRTFFICVYLRHLRLNLSSSLKLLIVPANRDSGRRGPRFLREYPEWASPASIAEQLRLFGYP